MRTSFFISVILVSLLFTVSLVGVCVYVSASDSADVAYILKDKDKPDMNLVNAVKEIGYTVDYISYYEMPNDFSGYKMLLIGNDKFPDTGKIPVSKYKSLIINSYNYYYSLGDYQLGFSKERGKVSSPAKIRNLEENSITSGIGEFFYAYSSNNPDVSSYYLKGQKASGIKIISYSFGSSHTNADGVIAIFPAGTKFLDGKTAEKRSLFFGIVESDFWTSESKQLFKNSVKWVITGEDDDKDGFYTDYDCNDSNASINPNATEIAYNGIDENCDGFDLRDVDADGFDSTIAGGDDCDDNNESINPSAYDSIDNLDQNCRNDAPVLINNLISYVWNEDKNKTDLFNLNEHFADREGQELSFRFEGNTNIDVAIDDKGNVSFFPRENWNGEEEIKFIASDSELETESNVVKITIRPVNDAPVIEEIPDIKIVEAELFELEVKVADADSEELELTFYPPLDSDGKWQTKIGDAGNYIGKVKAQDNESYDAEQFNIEVLPKIYINEIYVSDNEKWIELYNPADKNRNLSGFTIENENSKESQEINSMINAQDFLVIELNFNIVNGDEIVLKAQEKQIDSLVYQSGSTKSIARVPDGSVELKIQKPTKGLSNTVDALEPEIELISPENNMGFNVREVYFNFTARDNNASFLDCSFYSDLEGDFKKLGESIIVPNSSSAYVFVAEIPDGDYAWSIECSDGRNSAFTENRTFTLDAPDAPELDFIQDIEINETEIAKIIASATDKDGDVLAYHIDDSRFSQEGNVFEWQTDYSSVGEYELKVRASDGILNDSQIVKLKVLNVNRKPVLLKIPDTETEEDTTKEIELNVSDPDSDILKFLTIGDIKVDCEVINSGGKFILRIIPVKDKNGEAYCAVRVQDDKYGTDVQTAKINIIPVNDAPVLLKEIPNQIWKQNNYSSIELNKYFYDADYDKLEYIFREADNITVRVAGNLMIFVPDEDWYGEREMTIAARDRENFSVSNNFTLKVEKVNKNPVLAEIPEIEIKEDSGKQKSAELSARDLDGYIERYEVTNEEESKVDCTIEGAELYVEPAENWYGAASCEIQVTDSDGGTDSKTVKINVGAVNDAPRIYPSPSFNPIIKLNREQEFSIEKEDIDNTAEELKTEWYADNVKISEETDSFIYSANSLGKHEIKVIVKDPETSSVYRWNVLVTDKPVANNYNGETTDFSKIFDLANTDLILENEFGKIEFLEPVDLSDAVDFDHYSAIEYKKAGIDTRYFTSLINKEARISFYNVYEKQAIYYAPEFNMSAGEKAVICPADICKNILYENKTLSFETKNFGSFFVGPMLSCSAQGYICPEKQICSGSWLQVTDTDRCCSSACIEKPLELKDIETCEEKNSEIELDLREPDESDDFSVGETINGSLKIKNSADEDLEFDIEIYLYDTENDEEIQKVEESVEIDENKKETIEFELEIPEDVEGSGHIVYAKVTADNDKEYCNEIYQDINIERERHNVIIQDIKIEPATAKAGDYVEISVSVLNLGKKEETTYIEIENTQLSIKGRSDEFKLDDYFGKDNSATKRFNVKIPEDALGDYELKARVFFDSEASSKTQSFVVSESVELITKESAETMPLGAEKQEPITKSVKIKPNLSAIVIIELIFGIVILIVLIVVVSRRRAVKETSNEEDITEQNTKKQNNMKKNNRKQNKKTK